MRTPYMIKEDPQGMILITSIKVEKDLFKVISEDALFNERSLSAQVRFMLKRYVEMKSKTTIPLESGLNSDLKTASP